MTLKFTGKVILKFSKFILIKMFSFLSQIWLTVDRRFLFNPLHIPWILVETWLLNKGTNFFKLGIRKVGQEKKWISKGHSLKQFFDCCSCEIFTLYSEIFSFMFFHNDSTLYALVFNSDWTKIKQNLNVGLLSRPLSVVFSPFSLKNLLQFLSLAFLLHFWTVTFLFFP